MVPGQNFDNNFVVELKKLIIRSCNPKLSQYIVFKELWSNSWPEFS